MTKLDLVRPQESTPVYIGPVRVDIQPETNGCDLVRKRTAVLATYRLFAEADAAGKT